MKGFTLVELLVAVAVLAIGLVGVLRSFLGAVTVLDHLNTRLAAVVLLDEKAGLALIDSYAPDREPFDQAEEPVTVRGRSGVFRSSREHLEDDFYKGLDRVTLSVMWKERNVAKDETMVFLEQGRI